MSNWTWYIENKHKFMVMSLVKQTNHKLYLTIHCRSDCSCKHVILCNMPSKILFLDKYDYNKNLYISYSVLVQLYININQLQRVLSSIISAINIVLSVSTYTLWSKAYIDTVEMSRINKKFQKELIPYLPFTMVWALDMTSMKKTFRIYVQWSQ